MDNGGVEGETFARLAEPIPAAVANEGVIAAQRVGPAHGASAAVVGGQAYAAAVSQLEHVAMPYVVREQTRDDRAAVRLESANGGHDATPASLETPGAVAAA